MGCHMLFVYVCFLLWFIHLEQHNLPFLFLLEDLYCLSWICLNSLLFISWWQLVDLKPEPTLLPTHRIVNVPHHIDIVWEQLGFDDTVSYTQWWKFKLAKVMAWRIKPTTFRLGVLLQKESDTLITLPQRTLTLKCHFRVLILGLSRMQAQRHNFLWGIMQGRSFIDKSQR